MSGEEPKEEGLLRGEGSRPERDQGENQHSRGESALRQDRAPEHAGLERARERPKAHEVEPEVGRLGDHPRGVPVHRVGSETLGAEPSRHQDGEGEAQNARAQVPRELTRARGEGAAEDAFLGFSRYGHGYAEEQITCPTPFAGNTVFSTPAAFSGYIERKEA